MAQEIKKGDFYKPIHGDFIGIKFLQVTDVWQDERNTRLSFIGYTEEGREYFYGRPSSGFLAAMIINHFILMTPAEVVLFIPKAKNGNNA